MHRILNIAQLVGVCGEIEGRKKLQKIVHILQSSGYRSDFSQQFGYLHYGPYSSELRDEVETLKSDATLLTEEGRQVGGHCAFVYSAGEGLDTILQELGVNAEPAWAESARSLNLREARELEAISTSIYLKRLGLQGEALKSRFLALKPQLSSFFEKASDDASRLISDKG